MFKILFLIVFAQLASGLSSQTITVLSTKLPDRLTIDTGMPKGLTGLTNSTLGRQTISSTQSKATTTTLRSGLIMQFVQATSYTKPALFFKN